MAGSPASSGAVRRFGLVALLLAGACGLTGETQKGRAADLRAENLEQEAAFQRKTLEGPAEIESFILAYAGTDAARRALIARQADIQDAAGCPETAAFLERIERGSTSEAGKVLRIEAAVRRAELLLKDCHDVAGSVEAARKAERLAVKTPWEDDAYWVLGRACEQANMLEEALAAYDRIVQSRSDAFPFGSNDSLFLDDAWLAKGLLLERLGRHAEARDSLEGLLDARDTHLRPKAEEALARMKNK